MIYKVANKYYNKLEYTEMEGSSRKIMTKKMPRKVMLPIKILNLKKIIE